MWPKGRRRRHARFRGHVSKQARRLTRRAALRAGAALGALGAGLAVGTVGPEPEAANAAAEVTWRERLEVDFTPGDQVSVDHGDAGAPVGGDTFYMDGPIYAKEDIGGREAVRYHAFGVWTNDPADTQAPYQLLTTVQFRLFAAGSIMGLVNGGGTEPAGHEGAVVGGTGRYAGAQGIVRQQELSADPRVVVRATFDLLLPERG